MNTPYDILEVPGDANDAEIKQAYLRQVKKHPPDHEPEQFRLIHDAYLSIKDKKARLAYKLFTLPSADFDDWVGRALHTDRPSKITTEQFRALLRASIDEATTQKISIDMDN